MISPSLAAVRPYEEADRAKVLALGLHKGVIDTPENRQLVVEDGDTFGVVTWAWPGTIDMDIPTLGGVSISEPGRRDLYDKLLLAVCDAALDGGHTRGQAYVMDEFVLTLMQADFEITVTPVGRNVKTSKPGYWEIEFDLAKNREILTNSIGPQVGLK